MAIKIKTIDPVATQTAHGTVMNDNNAMILLDEDTRTFSGPTGYVVAVAGDANSQILTFKVPAEFDGVDLGGTVAYLQYYTDWIDLNGDHSWGVIDLSDTIVPVAENGVTKYYLFSWLLDLRQTAFPGGVKFDLKFTLTLEDGNSYYLPLYINVNGTQCSVYLDESGNACYYLPQTPDSSSLDHYYVTAGTAKNSIAHPLAYGAPAPDGSTVYFGTKVLYYGVYTLQTKQGSFNVVGNLGIEGLSEPIGNTGFETLLDLIADNRTDFLELKATIEALVPITKTRTEYDVLVANGTYLLGRTYDVIEGE